jgi:hypothetical protein
MPKGAVRSMRGRALVTPPRARALALPFRRSETRRTLMGGQAPRDTAVRAAPPARGLLVSGLLISLITAGALVRLRLGSLDDTLASLAGALAGAIFIPVAGAQLLARRLWPRPRRISPMAFHGVLVPWATAVASAAGLVVTSSLALARARAADLPGARCASFEELLAASWALDRSEGTALLAGLRNGSRVRFDLAGGTPACQSVRR